jgi:nicotinamidase-related amidase
MSNKALVVVDIQNDYFPGGANELVGSPEAAAVAVKVKAHFKNAGLPVIMIQHIAIKPGATFFLPDTHGVEIHESLKLEPCDELVVKHFPNSFRDTKLLEVLKSFNVTDLTIVGMMTHMCIDTTVRAASDLGFKVELIANACATKNLTHGARTVAAADVHAAYLAALDGTFATVTIWND